MKIKKKKKSYLLCILGHSILFSEKIAMKQNFHVELPTELQNQFIMILVFYFV